MTLTQERLKELLEYNPETGAFVWRFARGPRGAGAIAGSVGNRGYLVIRIDFKIYLAHRLAFLYMTGRWPTADTGHINCIRNDNRWTNLREATRGQNNANRGLTKQNKSGFKGVSWNSQNKKWVAHILHTYIGSFDDPREAHSAYCEAAMKLHGSYHRAVYDDV